MKLAVCAEPADAGDIDALSRALSAAGIDSFAFELDSGWEEREFPALESVLAEATHYLILWSERSAAATWIPFIAGHAAAPAFRAAVYRAPGSPRLPPYLSSLPQIDTREELVSYYAAEREAWLAEHDKAMARRELADMGAGLDAESMFERAREGDIRAISLFMRAGLSPNARNRHGVPLLSAAIRARHRRTAAFLMTQGADVDARSEDRGNTPLMDAAAAGAPEIVADLLARRARVDVKSKDGQTALIIAVGKNDVAAASLLLAAGADPDEIDKLGYSARMYGKIFKNKLMEDLFDRYPPRTGKS